MTELGVDILMEDSFQRFSSLFTVGRGPVDLELLDDEAADEATADIEHDARCLGTPSDPSVDGCTMSGRQWVEEKSGECCRSPASPAADPSSTCAPTPSVADASAFASWAVGDRYRLVRLLGHGSYGEVAEAWDTVAWRKVAIKRLVNAFDSDTDARRIFREMYILRQLRHPNIITLLDVIPPRDPVAFEALYLVFEFVDTDLYKLILSPQHLSDDHIQTFVYQMLLGLKYMQSANVIHRDVKPANILLSEDCSLKICDFGLARVVSPVCEPAPNTANGMGTLPPPPLLPPRLMSRQMSTDARKEEERRTMGPAGGAGSDASVSSCAPPRLMRQLTKHVVTRWYRAPELILLQDYTQAVDMWAVGCVLGELMSMQAESVPEFWRRRPLFPGRSCFPLSADPSQSPFGDKLDQLSVIFDIIGSPAEEDTRGLGPVNRYLHKLGRRCARPLGAMYPGASPQALDLLSRLLHFNPHKRLTVEQALGHPYLATVRDARLEAEAARPIVELELGHCGKEEIKRLILEEARLYRSMGDMPVCDRP
jgi:mitogen-activated protein kinase 1/3